MSYPAPKNDIMSFLPPEMNRFDWIIIGAQSSHGGKPEQQPDPKWVRSLMQQVWNAGRKVYCKPNLRASVKEYPEIGG